MKSQVSCFLLTAFVCMVIASTIPDVAVAQSDAPAKTAASSRILINVIVTDENGRPVRGLRAGDFTVFDNEESQRLLAFRVVAVQEATSIYALTVKAAHSDRSNEYHMIEVRVDRPNLSVRTIKGYYAHNQFSGK